MSGTITILSVLDFLERLSSRPLGGDGAERRAGRRQSLTLAVDILPLNERWIPCGARRRAVTHDLSPDGIRLFADVPVRTRFLKLWLPTGPDECAEEWVEVNRCEPLAFLYDIGGRFVEPGCDT